MQVGRRQDERRSTAGGRQTADISVIVAAYRRGWTQTHIAIAAGVSHQAVQNRLLRYEEKYGKIERVERQWPINKAKVVVRCLTCGIAEWKELKAADHLFCSRICFGRFSRTIRDEDIEVAIALRREGHTWTGIAQLIGATVQAVQTRIWLWLFDHRQLRRQTVEELWANDRYWAYTWLEKNTGLVCSEHGGQVVNDQLYPSSHPMRRMKHDRDQDHPS